MLVIRRTEDARLQVSNNRHSRVVDSETEARRTLHSWGHTDVSINKALTELRRAEGNAGTAHAWRAVRPEPVKPAVAADAAPASAATHEEPSRQRKPAVPPPAAPPPAAAPASAPKEASAPPAPKKYPRPEKAEKAKGKKTTAVERDPPAPNASAEPTTKPAPSRKVRADPEPAAAPAAKRPSAARQKPATPRQPTRDRRLEAVELASRLADALRVLEGDTLPFARGPWADLRGKAEHIAACLRGKKPRA